MKSYRNLVLVALLGFSTHRPFVQSVFTRTWEDGANPAAFVGAGLMLTRGPLAVSFVPLERAVIDDGEDSWGASMTVRLTP